MNAIRVGFTLDSTTVLQQRAKTVMALLRRKGKPGLRIRGTNYDSGGVTVYFEGELKRPQDHEVIRKVANQ